MTNTRRTMESRRICCAATPETWLCRLSRVDDTPSSPSHSPPECRVDRNRLHAILAHVQESAVVLDSTIPKEPRQQRKRVLRQPLVDEWPLFLERVNRTATRLTVVIQRRFYDLREELGSRAKALGRTSISAIQGLPEHELPAIGRVPQVEQVGDPTA